MTATPLTLARSITTLRRGFKTLLVISPANRLTRRALGPLLDRRLVDLSLALAKNTAPGDLGTVSSTLIGSGPARLALAVLPNQVSRYNAPSRSECIRKVVGDIGAAAAGKTSILLLLDDAAHFFPALNAIGRALPRYSAKSASKKSSTVEIFAVDQAGKPIIPDRFSVEVAAAARTAAEWVDTPPSELHPQVFAEKARAELRGLPRVTVREIVGPELLREKLNGIHAVGRAASLSAPRLVVASYSPPTGKSKGKKLPHIALVGKGVTYDTGGLSLKPGQSMVHMKCDMAGAAATLGAFRALVMNQPAQRLSLLLCVAENAIGPASFKPDDILTLHSGKTVEINNTDAEGRLLLADGVSYAARVLGADIILDAATLTGAQLIATGLAHAAVISNDADLETTLVAAGRDSGDLVHPLPFAPEFFQREFKSSVADMTNSVKNRTNAQTSCAAQFIYSHLESDKTPRWGHVDLAGPAFPADRATGFGVALLAETVRKLAS